MNISAYRLRWLLLLALPLDAMAQGAPDPAQFPDPARLRVFGQNGVGLTLYTNAVCKDDYEEEIEVSGSLGNGFRALAGKRVPNISLGMPETVGVRTMEEGKVFMAKPYYREYALIPGQPVRVRAGIKSAANMRCASDFDVAFTPEAGADYEVAMRFDMQACLLTVMKVAADGQLSPQPFAPAKQRCDTPRPEAQVPLLVFFFAPEEVHYRLSGNASEWSTYEDTQDEAESFDDEVREALQQPGAKVCAVAPAGGGSPLYARLRALVHAHDDSAAVWEQAESVRQALDLPQGQPLEFPAAAYQCMKAASRAFGAK
ncbi:hypothetical protein [Xanthomonas bundabergensis]|uniref:hypothetical protein n=1 Tax=Xanthomonas bundabergensis TaxID=3160842 RepID=UPI0035175EF7